MKQMRAQVNPDPQNTMIILPTYPIPYPNPFLYQPTNEIMTTQRESEIPTYPIPILLFKSAHPPTHCHHHHHYDYY